MRRLFQIACGVLAVIVLLVMAFGWVVTPRDDPKVDTNFDNFPALAEGIGKANRVELYEGLPHQHNESGIYSQELLTKRHFFQHGYAFYAQPLELKPSDAAELLKTVSNSANFQPWAGEKKCGGYHPDYEVEWHTSDGVFRCQVCLGCCEAKLFGPRSELHCDMTHETKQKLQALLKPYRKNRPEPQVD
jgi:hypothetical protein